MMPISSNTSTSLLPGNKTVQGKPSQNKFQKIDLNVISHILSFLGWPQERLQATSINKDFFKASKILKALGSKYTPKFLQIANKYDDDSLSLAKTISFATRHFFTRTESSYIQGGDAPLPIIFVGKNFCIITRVKLGGCDFNFKETWKSLFFQKDNVVESGGLTLTKQGQITYEFEAELFVWDLINEIDRKFHKFFPKIFTSIETSEKVIFFHEFFPKNLQDLLSDNLPIKEKTKLKLALSLVNQIAVLHDHKVVLRYIVPTIISVNLEKGVAYLTDFCATMGFTQNENNEIESFGAPFPKCLHNYLPYEFHLGRLNSTSDDQDIEANQWLNQRTNDIWQLGITLGLLFFRKFLGIYEEDSLDFDAMQEKVDAWVNCDLQTKIPGKYKDSPVIPLILSMLDPDPSKRPTIMEVAENLAALAKKHHNLDLEIVKFD